MKTLLSSFALWSLLVTAQTSAPPTIIVSGTVVDADSREPIGRAKVTIARTGVDVQNPQITYTDSLGAFRFSVLALGQYGVRSELDGYVPTFSDAHRSFETIDLSPKGGNARVTVYLRREVVISGILSDPGGNEIAGNVKVFRLEVEDGWPAPVAIMAAVTEQPGANQSRFFRIGGLEPGRYLVAFFPSWYAGIDHPFLVYPNSSDAKGGEILEMVPGRERFLDFRVPRIQTYTVSGKVATTDKAFFPSIERLTDNGLPTREDFGGMHNTVNFTFQHTKIPPGKYLVCARWTDGGKTVYGAKRISVPGPESEGIVLEPASALNSLRGVLKVDPSIASKFTLGVVVELVGADVRRLERSKPDGSFLFDDIPSGRYKVRVVDFAASFLKSIRQAGREVTHEGIVIGDGAAEPLEISMSAGTARVNVTADIRGINLDPGLMVGFLRNSGTSWVLQRTVAAIPPLRYRPQTERGSGVDPDGKHSPGDFHLEGLPAGEYLVFAWLADSGTAKELPYNTPEFQRHFGSAAEKITVRESENVELTVHRLLPPEAFGLN